jgi:hypothetical protein
MTDVVAKRAPAGRARSTPPGTGELHQALEDARDRAELNDFCSAHVCTPDQVSIDGKRLDLLMVLDFWRTTREMTISQPVRAKTQPLPGKTKWLVDATLPTGEEFKLGFFTTNAPTGRDTAVPLQQQEKR